MTNGELIGAGSTNSRSAGSSGSAVDINLKVVNDTYINDTKVFVDGTDRYLYVANAGTGNGTSDAGTSATLLVYIEYYGLD